MDKNTRWKLLLLVVLLGLAAYALIPSIRLYSMPASARTASNNDEELRKTRSQAIKLGLDLQGGMHLVLQIDKTNLKPDEVPDALDRAMQILRTRIDQFGVAEPMIQQQGNDRILIQLPGLLDRQRAMDLIGQTAALEFKLVKQPADAKQVMERLDRALAKMKGIAPVDTSKADTATANRPLIDHLYNFPEADREGGFIILDSERAAIDKLFASVKIDSLLPLDASIGFSQKDEAIGGGLRGWGLFVMNRRPELTGSAISTAIMRFNLDPNRPNTPGVSMTLNPRGTTIFRRVTGANIGRQLAIVLDNRVCSAPVIKDRIPNGQAQITGSFTSDQAKDLAIVLRAGALPAPIQVAEERTVGPSLGRDSVRSGLNAGIMGTAVVILFMLFYYRLSGVVSIIALLLNIIFLFAGMAALRGTLTLPGIAGIVLTIGMAVDSNVLIFERIREELRSGKRVRTAIDAGYQRAWRTIIDTHLTNFISAAVLWEFGTGPIKGFAVTLAIGMAANLYTAVLVTKMIFEAFVSHRESQTLSI